jgi:hypothetical protein
VVYTLVEEFALRLAFFNFYFVQFVLTVSSANGAFGKFADENRGR